MSVGLIVVVTMAMTTAGGRQGISLGDFRWSYGPPVLETRAVDPAHLQFLFQGVLDKDRQGKGYGEIPWRLGLLEPTK